VESSALRCIDCARPLQVVYGRWLPQCGECLPSAADLPEPEPEYRQWCWECGRALPADRECGPCADRDFRCADCRSAPPLGAGRVFYCPACCDWLSHLHPNEDPCLISRLRAVDNTMGRHPISGWPARFHNRDSDAVRRIIESEDVCCSQSLLTYNPEPLPNHVCSFTLREGCARAFPLDATGSLLDGAEYEQAVLAAAGDLIGNELGLSPAEARDLVGRFSDPADGIGMAPWEETALNYLQISVPADERVQWVESVLNYLQLLRSAPTRARSPAWEVPDAPMWPVVSDEGLVGLVVVRACETGRVTLYGTLSTEDLTGQLRLSDARVDTRSRGADRAARKWLRTQEDSLSEWYATVLLGQRIHVGRPPVSGPEREQRLQRFTLELREMKNPTVATVAARMDVPVDTLKSWMRDGIIPRRELWPDKLGGGTG